MGLPEKTIEIAKAQALGTAAAAVVIKHLQ
jgi:hypothetical protein